MTTFLLPSRSTGLAFGTSGARSGTITFMSVVTALVLDAAPHRFARLPDGASSVGG
ncbi:hypothetical protein [Oerskovia sp. Root22]|uniref:hypothetical protein n=1 Tax=Oerskovia sp. Root22 TaxID=1736494 RepID=UPI000AC9D4EB|nr:hypothetical protein [Oerskovia sp. Root22]